VLVYVCKRRLFKIRFGKEKKMFFFKKINHIQKLILLIRSLQRTTSKRIPATKKIGGKRQSPRSFFPGIEFDTAKAINRQSGNLARIFLNIS